MRTSVRAIDPYAWELSSEAVAARHGLHVRDVVRFDLNTSPFPPASWDAAMEAAHAEGQPNEYFDTSYAELAALFSAHYGVGTDHLIIGAGADEILDIATKTFLDNGDRVVVSVPTYSMYPIVSEQMGATVHRVPLLADFVPDIDGILAAAAGAKIVWHCNPNSPTGNATDPAAMERLIAAAPCMVVVDEAYAEYVDWSAVPLIARYPQLVVVRTMSKAFGMAGMRLACGIAAPAVIEMMTRVRPPNSVSRVTARVGAAALRDIPAMRANVAAIVAQREPFADALWEIGAHVYPSVTNFVLTRWESPAVAQAIYDWLEARGIVVRNFADHPLLPGHLRFTVRTAEENARLLAALKEWRRAR
ncbi:MAG: histidinol-phosphate transaminase [Thermomicrobia bacterium]|nr:histidinol-phosphate transaminase [Thermomicrobia bacterium]